MPRIIVCISNLDVENQYWYPYLTKILNAAYNLQSAIKFAY